MFDRSTIVWATVFNQKRCWTTTSQFMCICRTSAELEDPNSIATRKAFSTRNETSIFNKSHLVRLLLTVGNSKHVLVGPLGRDVPLRPRTTNHKVSLYSFRVLDKLTFYKKKLNTIKNLAPKSTIKVISCSNENEIFLKFQFLKKRKTCLCLKEWMNMYTCMSQWCVQDRWRQWYTSTQTLISNPWPMLNLWSIFYDLKQIQQKPV